MEPAANATAARRVRLVGAGRAFLQQSGLLLALIVLFVALSISAENFLTSTNLLNVLRQAAFVGIVAFGMTLVIIGAEIDISVGSQVALSSALLGVLNVNEGWPLWASVVVVILGGAAIGLAAGFVRAHFNVPSFIVTLALFISLRGVALLITNAFPISISSDRFQFWGAGYVARIPVPALVMVGVFLVFWFVSTRTSFGRSVYAVGGNADAARLSGIPVERVRTVLLGITGGLAAITGVLLSARLASGNANVAVGLEFDVIAAVIIGGTLLFGGRGSMVGTLMGVLFISILANGLVLLGVSPFAQDVVRGAIVLVAVLFSNLQAPKARS